MPIRQADAQWNGNLKEGNGRLRVESGALDAPYTFSSRFEASDGTNPEELIGAALAGCFSLSLANMLSEAGHTPDEVATTARVHLEDLQIKKIHMVTRVNVSGVEDADFQNLVNDARENCIISRALSGVPEITADAKMGEGTYSG